MDNRTLLSVTDDEIEYGFVLRFESRGSRTALFKTSLLMPLVGRSFLKISVKSKHTLELFRSTGDEDSNTWSDIILSVESLLLDR